MIILDNHINEARASHLEIQSYILSLLDIQKDTSEIDKKIDLRSGLITVDIYCPQGIRILNLDKPLAIEVKVGLLMHSYERELRKGLEFINMFPNSEYWVVYADTRLQVPCKYDEKIKFISLTTLKAMVQRPTIEQQDTHHTEDKESLSIQRDVPDQKTLIDKAAKALVNSNCSFILGAGISVDAGSPLWDDLLKNLINSINKLRPLDSQDYQDINGKCGWSTLITGRYIIGNNISRDDLIDGMRSNIYTLPPRNYKTPLTALPRIAKIIKRFNVESSLTFNYDEFLEDALQNESVKFDTIIDKGSMKKGRHAVYHVHGLISRKANQASSYPVLSEKEYHLLYSNNFHWSNIELLHALMRNTCFLLGLSMTDPNLRRLLEMARYDDGGTPRHYIFMRKDPLNANRPLNAKDDKHWQIIEDQYAELGLNIIWYDYNPLKKNDFSDLAKKLDLIFDSAEMYENQSMNAGKA